jgi:hypothetical protein
MAKLQEAKQLLNSNLLVEIFSTQVADVVERFKQAEPDDVPQLVACNIETRALERLKECIHDECKRIIDAEEPPVT